MLLERLKLISYYILNEGSHIAASWWYFLFWILKISCYFYRRSNNLTTQKTCNNLLLVVSSWYQWIFIITFLFITHTFFKQQMMLNGQKMSFLKNLHWQNKNQEKLLLMAAFLAKVFCAYLLWLFPKWNLHHLGIEPRTTAWKAVILPLN